MTTFFDLILVVAGQVWLTLQHNWPFLLVSTIIAACLKLYLDADAIGRFLRRHQASGVLAATGAAVATPLCSCGTTAVILGMLAGSMPWAPIIAFMVASPLTSPQELIYSAGLFGWPFALAFFGASIVLGLAGGGVAHLADMRGWLKNQARFTEPAPRCTCAPPAAPLAATTATGGYQPAAGAMILTLRPALASGVAGPGTTASACPPVADRPVALRTRLNWRAFGAELVRTGGRLLALFLAFAFIGYLLNDLIPAAWITTLFGAGRAYSVPLAATFGLPFYINTEASLPLVRAMLYSGMSEGAALAFLLTGAGTSLGAIAGALTIARWRVLAVVMGTLWVGAILGGLAYDTWLAAAIR
jgi:uncharacterized protein